MIVSVVACCDAASRGLAYRFFDAAAVGDGGRPVAAVEVDEQNQSYRARNSGRALQTSTGRNATAISRGGLQTCEPPLASAGVFRRATRSVRLVRRHYTVGSKTEMVVAPAARALGCKPGVDANAPR